MIKIDKRLNEASGNQKVFVEHYDWQSGMKLHNISFHVINNPNHRIVYAGFYENVEDRRNDVMREYTFASKSEYRISDAKRSAYEVAYVEEEPLWAGLVEKDMYMNDLVWEALNDEGVVDSYWTHLDFKDWLRRRSDNGENVVFALRGKYQDFRTIHDIHLKIWDAEPEDFDVS